MQPFLLGVNYWPRRKAMYWWRNFDAAEVDEEFALIAELGMKIVRIFLLWDDFQPEPDKVDPAALANLVTVADTAARYGLGLDLTFFTGHMSGPNWAPRWMLEKKLPLPERRQVVSAGTVVRGGYANMFNHPVALSAERLLLQTVVSELKCHPGIWAWNLGNEPDLFAWPESEAQGQTWTREMRELICEIDPVHPVTYGLHMRDLLENTGLRVDQVFREVDLAVMHAYSMYLPLRRNPLDPDLVPFACALTASLAGKPVLMEEFGGCTVPPGKRSSIWKWFSGGKLRLQFMSSEEAMAGYLAETLPRLVEVGALGALLWCFADYAPHLWDVPPCKDWKHERFFGLVRPDGSLKPHAQVIKDFAATYPVVQPIPEYARFDLDADAFYKSNLYVLVLKLYRQYLSARTSGTPCQPNSSILTPRSL